MQTKDLLQRHLLLHYLDHNSSFNMDYLTKVLSYCVNVYEAEAASVWATNLHPVPNIAFDVPHSRNNHSTMSWFCFCIRLLFRKDSL